MRKIALLSLALCALILFQPALAYAEKIGAIQIEGTNRIENNTILSYMTLKIGDDFSSVEVNRSLKTLFSTGFFSDVKLVKQGTTLLVQVVENPIINRIAFEGNDQLDDDQLQAEVTLRPRVVYTRAKVKQDVERILQLYRRSGLFTVAVEPKVIFLDQNRLDLVFEVNEGVKSYIQGINFIGNKMYSDEKLRGVVLSREERWYRFLGGNDTYDEDRMSFDEELLRRFYLANGYAEFEVETTLAELTPDRQDFFLTFQVKEGERYRFGEIEFENNIKNLPLASLTEEITIPKGDWYDADWVEDTTLELTERAGNLQYGFIDIRPEIDMDRENKTVSLKYVINESPRVFVERIDVKGNLRTLDSVVRREMLLLEGDPYNLTKLKRSERNIRNLDFFDSVEVNTQRGSRPDLAVVEIRVSEKSTGELSIGGGFSTLDGPLADFRIRERNLLGRGQNLSLATTISGESQQIDLSFTEPYFLDRKLSAGFDIFHTVRDFQDESSFDQQKTGAGVRIGYPLGKDVFQTVRYRVENNNIEDVEADASTFIKRQEGERLTSEISHTTTYDTRDSLLNPTEGTAVTLSNGFAGIGGDAQYFSTRLRGVHHTPFFDNDVVLTTLSEVGYIYGYADEDIFITDRYFIGGRTMRGFDNAGIGPRDTATGDALGGNRFVRGTVEVEFPIGLPEELGVKMHLFTDVATLGDVDDEGATVRDEESLRVASGFGMSWQSPLGPIKAYLATPLMKEDYDETQVFQFSFGTSF